MGNIVKKLPAFRFGDLLVISAVLILALYFITSASTEDNKLKRLVLVNGTQTINLSWKNETIDLEKLINKKMLVEVQDGKARVISSNCPDKVCVHTGWVSECGHIAACLPNGVALMVECREDLNVTEQ